MVCKTYRTHFTASVAHRVEYSDAQCVQVISLDRLIPGGGMNHMWRTAVSAVQVPLTGF